MTATFTPDDGSPSHTEVLPGGDINGIHTHFQLTVICFSTLNRYLQADDRFCILLCPAHKRCSRFRATTIACTSPLSSVAYLFCQSAPIVVKR